LAIAEFWSVAKSVVAAISEASAKRVAACWADVPRGLGVRGDIARQAPQVGSITAGVLIPKCSAVNAGRAISASNSL
jgi:hypothetical protein